MSDFDELDSFASFDPVDDQFEPNADAASDAVTSRVLVSDETGVSFEALVLFAEPMFHMYGLDAGDAFALKHSSAAADPEMATVLLTSRVLWAFFSLAPTQRSHSRSLLAAHLVGGHPTEEDWLEIEALLEAVEPYWSAMLPEEIRSAEAVGHPTLSLDELLSHPAFQLSEEPSDISYGADALSEIEARALFAQPLLEKPEVLIDADLFEIAMERANAYWRIASLPEARQKEALAEIAAQFSIGKMSSEAIREEAQQMVERFHALFPKH